jgi:hypothetical protein
MSKGEDKIVDLLNREKIFFVREKSFKDLKHGLFRYDFYLPYLNGGPAIIEFNGEQHYYYVSRFFKKNTDFTKVQEHDRRKISYALANNIKIYIIPYWELPKISSSQDLFNEKYLARSRWKNDEDYEYFIKHQNL